MTPTLPRELLIYTIARLLDGARHVAVGAASPLPAAGALLRRALDQQSNRKLRISILGSVEHNMFTNGSTELFDSAAQGRIDTFFLGGGQVDGHANVNLVGIGEYPRMTVRWPGSFGSAFLYSVVPRIILFREEHTPRVLVDKVDFISANGISVPGVHRTGGPVALLTGKCLFRFDRDLSGFVLESIHPGHDAAEIRRDTGFDYRDCGAAPTEMPDVETLALLRGPVLSFLSETYPEFADAMRLEVEANRYLDHEHAAPVLRTASATDKLGHS